MFRIQKRHISGTIPGKIQVPLCQNLCFLSYSPPFSPTQKTWLEPKFEVSKSKKNTFRHNGTWILPGILPKYVVF
jgi:hypothetical protein